jgi:hypothetical protein
MDLLRCAGSLLVVGSLTGCVALKHQSGVLLTNKEHVDYYSTIETAGDRVFLRKPPMYISLVGKEPADHVLLAGPFVLIPLPVIPWPPGIIAALFSKPGSKVSSESLKITLSFDTWNIFSRHYGEGPYPKWSFNPNEVEFSQAGQSMHPKSVRLESSALRDLGKRKEVTTADCISVDKSGRIAFSVASDANGGKCHLVQVNLEFEVPQTAADGGVIRIPGFTANGTPVVVPDTLVRIGGRMRWWAGPIIND